MSPPPTALQVRQLLIVLLPDRSEGILKMSIDVSGQTGERVLLSRTMHVVAQAVPIPGLELGTLLAVSPYGRTHRGFYKGQPVAVKVRHSLQPCYRILCCMVPRLHLCMRDIRFLLRTIL